LSGSGCEVVLVEGPLHPLADRYHDASVRRHFLAFAGELQRDLGVRVLTLEGTDSVTVMKTHFEKGLFLDTGEDDDAAHLEDSSLEGPFKMIGGISTFSGGATLIIINVSFGVSSDGDDKFFWAFVVINRF
jgi:hypothetical protein